MIMAFVSVVALKVAGFQLFTVMSGSMEPILPVGSVVLVEPVSFDEVQIGDDVTFVVGEEKVVVTHRVIEKDEENQTVTTKGVANDVPDEPIPQEAIIGLVKADIPAIGKVLYFLSTMQGKICAGITLVALILVSFFAGKITESYGDVSSNMELDEAVITGLYVPTVTKKLEAVNLQYKNCALNVRSLVFGYVWAETDYNGICDGYVQGDPNKTTEQLLSNIEVVLKDAAGNQVAKTVTSKTGYYEFSNIASGDYSIEFVKASEFTANGKIPEDVSGFGPLVETKKAETTDTQLGNCATGKYENGYLVGLTTDKFTVKEASLKEMSTNGCSTNVNAAMFAPSTVSGAVWEDSDFDGIRDNSEKLLTGVRVTLLESDGTNWSPVLLNGKAVTVQTGQAIDIITGELEDTDVGTYAFEGLSSGTYAVRMESGDYDIRYYRVSPQNVGDNDNIDSDAKGTYSTDGDMLQSALISDILIPTQNQMTGYGYNASNNDMGIYQELRDVTVTKQLHANEINWSYGTPIFLITVYGTDQNGTYHEFNHVYEFTKDYVKKNTDDNGIVSMTYTFEGIPYAEVYNVEESNTSKYQMERISGSANATFNGNIASLNLKYDVSGEVTILNKISNYKDTCSNALVINSLITAK